MARTLAQLPRGARITDYISLGVVAQWFPRSRVNQVLAKSGKTSRWRDLPAHVVVYYVLALYRQVSYRAGLRCLLEGLQVAPRSAQAAARGGQLGDLASPHAAGMGTAPAAARRAGGSRGETPNPSAFYRRWRLVSPDGSTLDVTDGKRNREAFGRPERAAAPVPFRKSASCPSWKTAPMCCSPAAWAPIPRGKSRRAR